jgi:hypothetical protein
VMEENVRHPGLRRFRGSGNLRGFVRHGIPELQRRGLFHQDYAGKTLREKLGLPRARGGLMEAVGEGRGGVGNRTRAICACPSRYGPCRLSGRSRDCHFTDHWRAHPAAARSVLSRLTDQAGLRRRDRTRDITVRARARTVARRGRARRSPARSSDAASRRAADHIPASGIRPCPWDIAHKCTGDRGSR